ncbi:MAG: hypothetical protein JO326_06885, partial [Acetobacteraceae bacterium]|nr:hypothetical protein [Acetobacteraceae bacterium]
MKRWIARAFGLLAGVLSLAGCVPPGQQATGAFPYGTGPAPLPAAGGPVNLAPPPIPQPHAIALLAPMTGANAERGTTLANA